jgi:hypothetical protein
VKAGVLLEFIIIKTYQTYVIHAYAVCLHTLRVNFPVIVETASCKTLAAEKPQLLSGVYLTGSIKVNLYSLHLFLILRIHA